VTTALWQVFGFALSAAVIICGTLLCFIGVVIAMPIVKAATGICYEDIFGDSPRITTTSVPAVEQVAGFLAQSSASGIEKMNFARRR